MTRSGGRCSDAWVRNCHRRWATRIGRGRNQRATASPPKKAPLKASAMRDKSEGLREELDAGATGHIGELDSGSAAKVRAVSWRNGTGRRRAQRNDAVNAAWAAPGVTEVVDKVEMSMTTF